MKGRITLLLVVSISLLCACTSLDPAEQPSPLPAATPKAAVFTNEQEILGIWEQTVPEGAYAQSKNFIQFKEDGTSTIAARVATNIEDNPQVQGRYEIDSGVLVLVTSDESALCLDQTGTFDLQWTAEGYLHFSPLEDPCSFRGGWALLNEAYRLIQP